jgi:hypothetical protein
VRGDSPTMMLTEDPPHPAHAIAFADLSPLAGRGKKDIPGRSRALSLALPLGGARIAQGSLVRKIETVSGMPQLAGLAERAHLDKTL